MKLLKKLFILIVIMLMIAGGYVVYDYIDSSDLEIAGSMLFNRYGFIMGENKLGVSSFFKDANIKYSEAKPLCIESREFNDASFIKDFQVKPYTLYKVSCMVKTEDVMRDEGNRNAGANISVIGTSEKSESLIGDNEWTQLNLYFNSKNRTSVEIALRLGSYDGYAKGKCWFSNFKIEESAQTPDSNWKILCLIYRDIDVDVEINGKMQNIKISMSDDDVSVIKDNIQRYTETIRSFSNNKMTAEYDVVIIDTPIKTLTYSEENGYYVAPEDIEADLKQYLFKDEYDHVFVTCRLTDNSNEFDIPIKDWIGLGSIDYLGIGYSLIRLPDSRTNYIYKYSNNVQFPEEVFVHEFIHTLERNQSECGYSVPDLHGHTVYGYESKSKVGLKEWYIAYMNKVIEDTTTSQYVGLEEFVYTLKPGHESDFIESIVIDETII